MTDQYTKPYAARICHQLALVEIEPKSQDVASAIARLRMFIIPALTCS